MPNRSHPSNPGWPSRPTRTSKPHLSLSLPSPSSTLGSRLPTRTLNSVSNLKRKKFACPYRQKYPRCKPSAPACLHAFTSIARLKEHLYRCHMKPYRCLRCHATFEDQISLESHVRASVSEICVPRQQPELLTFGREEEEQLRKRSSSKKSDEEKWTGLYRTLFPNDAGVPSPYHDEVPLAEYREYACDNLPGMLMHALSTTSDLASLPQSVRESMVQVLYTCNDNLVQQFQQSQQLEAALEGSDSASTTSALVSGSTRVSSANTPDTHSEFDLLEWERSGSHANPVLSPVMGTSVLAVPTNTTITDQLSTPVSNGPWTNMRESMKQPYEVPSLGSGWSSADFVTDEALLPTSDAQLMSMLLSYNITSMDGEPPFHHPAYGTSGGDRFGLQDDVQQRFHA